jgi:hypothetical protein
MRWNIIRFIVHLLVSADGSMMGRRALGKAAAAPIRQLLNAG